MKMRIFFFVSIFFLLNYIEVIAQKSYKVYAGIDLYGLVFSPSPKDYTSALTRYLNYDPDFVKLDENFVIVPKYSLQLCQQLSSKFYLVERLAGRFTDRSSKGIFFFESKNSPLFIDKNIYSLIELNIMIGFRYVVKEKGRFKFLLGPDFIFGYNRLKVISKRAEELYFAKIRYDDMVGFGITAGVDYDINSRLKVRIESAYVSARRTYSATSFRKALLSNPAIYEQIQNSNSFSGIRPVNTFTIFYQLGNFSKKTK